MFGSFDRILEMSKTPRKSPQRSWSPVMAQRASGEDAKQIACLTADAGHMWMRYHDQLPAPIRHRLAASRHNICAACLTIEAERRKRPPSVATFICVLVEIERQLDGNN
jgi:hypothetical protein